jgi:hypothetical protein
MAKLTLPSCEICGRALTSVESIAAGIGPDCAASRAGFYGAAGLTVESVDALAANPEPDVQRWLRSMRSAIRQHDIYFARRFYENARAVT